ncbi:MAG: DUF4214 domain-containing protein [Actinomycetia bacterium]|nr:DUF4214 domain-containing protein [Actinomycetes bacterium]
MSDSFVQSAEFQLRYGDVTNAGFVTLVYQNVLGRDPDPVGFDHWRTALDSGYLRGSVMIALVPVPQEIGTVYADVLMINTGVWESRVLSAVYFDNYEPVDLFRGVVLEPQTHIYLYNIPLAADATDVLVNSSSPLAEVNWSVVFYDHPHSTDRPGWAPRHGGSKWSSPP